MSNKAKFISEINNAISNGLELSEEAMEYLSSLSVEKTEERNITETGIKILNFMIENSQEDPKRIFQAKEIGTGLFMSSRSVSGSIRKLVTDGYCEKLGKDPVYYSLTDAGRNYELN